MRNLILVLIAIITTSLGYGQSNKDLNIKYMLRGYFYAHSSVIDSLAFGGFGGSGNTPKGISESNKFMDNDFYLSIDTTENVVFAEKFNGYKLYLINTSDSIVKLDAQDSRLYIWAEAYVDDKWQAIEYLPSSWCGNSYHTVFLKNGEYWNFNIPKYDGKIKTKLRYALMLGKGEYIYSNSISVGINKKQLTEKQGHIASGIMDPYDD